MRVVIVSAAALFLVALQGCNEATQDRADLASGVDAASPPRPPELAPATQKRDGDVASTIPPGPDAQTRIQEAFILAQPGAVIQLEEGHYELNMQLSIDVSGVTVRGRGMDKTVLSFKNQDQGSEGIYVTGDNVALEDFAIEDTKGNGHKSNGADNHVLRRVRAEWTGGPKETNGAYGMYPVSSKNVLIEGCVSIGASDAGIYVGQSENIIVRGCRAERNVAGIEIENCHGADVYDNVAAHNAGGILVFDLPDLPVQRGRDVRVFKNHVVDNDVENFAPKGNIVGTVPTGTGIMIMANSNVEIFENEIGNNQTTNLLLVSYLTTGREIKDANYYPYAEGIHVHHNRLGPSGYAPAGEGGTLMAALAGSPLPDIIWDGVVNEAKLVEGKLPAELGLYIHDNTKTEGELTYANLGGTKLLSEPQSVTVQRDLAVHAGELPSLKPITLPEIAG
ncbi:MAG: right-handed parallel beta-helix repeat-containing protein [Candidatus Hydrogenedentes bacterium]|nr:right-handed parallel beta-helix repeat-containing protein [Candidatus Hydrogenedentota bacterium]